MATVTVIDLLLFHTMERNLYDRLVHRMGISTEVAKQSIALWLWLESIGHYDLIRHIQAHQDDVLRCIVDEAEACLACIRPNEMLPTHNVDIPILASLINEPMNLRFFHYHREVAVNGITKIINTVCNVIFDDNLMREAATDPNHPANQMLMSAGFVRPFGESASLFAGGGISSIAPVGGQSSLALPPPADAQSPSLLNPHASPWTPPPEQTPEEQRSMFLTFSRGYSLRREEILEFFTSKWGNCVQSLTVERTAPGIQPMFGRIVFKTTSVIPSILNGQDKAKFVIKGKHMWARVFVPKRD